VQAFQAGAKGYITKSSPRTLLIEAVREVAAGRRAIGQDMSEALAVTLMALAARSTV